MNMIAGFIARRKLKQQFGSAYPLLNRLRTTGAPTDGLAPDDLRLLDRRWKELGSRSGRGSEHVMEWCVNHARAERKTLQHTTEEFEALVQLKESSAAELKRLGRGFF